MLVCNNIILCTQKNSRNVQSKVTSITKKIHNFEKSRLKSVHDSIDFFKKQGHLEFDNLKKLSKDISFEICNEYNLENDISYTDTSNIDVTNIDEILDENDSFFEN